MSRYIPAAGLDFGPQGAQQIVELDSDCGCLSLFQQDTGNSLLNCHTAEICNLQIHLAGVSGITEDLTTGAIGSDLRPIPHQLKPAVGGDIAIPVSHFSLQVSRPDLGHFHNFLHDGAQGFTQAFPVLGAVIGADTAHPGFLRLCHGKSHNIRLVDDTLGLQGSRDHAGIAAAAFLTVGDQYDNIAAFLTGEIQCSQLQRIGNRCLASGLQVTDDLDDLLPHLGHRPEILHQDRIIALGISSSIHPEAHFQARAVLQIAY